MKKRRKIMALEMTKNTKANNLHFKAKIKLTRVKLRIKGKRKREINKVN